MYMYTYMYRLSQAGFESGGWRQGKRVVWAEQGVLGEGEAGVTSP